LLVLPVAAINCCEPELDMCTSSAWLLTAMEPKNNPVMRSEMAARIVNVYFRTLHFTDTEFSLVHPDNLLNSIFFYYKNFYHLSMLSIDVFNY
jgi:hypothetical protein